MLTAVKHYMCITYVMFMVHIKIWLYSSGAKLVGFAEVELAFRSPSKAAVKDYGNICSVFIFKKIQDTTPVTQMQDKGL